MREIRVFSDHAIRRCMERGITESSIEQAVLLGELTAERGDTQIWARGRLRVVVNTDGLVITAWRVRRWNPKRYIQKYRTRIRRFQRGQR